jgi:hypothetical protein
MSNDGWTGVRTGPMRGQPLTLCRRHGGWWTALMPCPACGLAARVVSLEGQLGACQQQQRDDQARRCAECRQRPTCPMPANGVA